MMMGYGFLFVLLIFVVLAGGAAAWLAWFNAGQKRGNPVYADSHSELRAKPASPEAAGGRRFCPHCGAGLRDGWTFCPQCGAPAGS